MAVALAVEFEEALVIARGADRLAVVELKGRQRPGWRGCWMPTRHGSPCLLPSAMTLPPMLIRAFAMPASRNAAAARSSATPSGSRRNRARPHVWRC